MPTDFTRGDAVKHRASGEPGVVLRKFVECSAPDHVLTGPDGARVFLCQMRKADGSPAVTTPDAWATDGYEVGLGHGERVTCYAEELEPRGPAPSPPAPPVAANEAAPKAWPHGEVKIGVRAAPPGDTRVGAVLVTMDQTGKRQVVLRQWHESRALAEEWCRDVNAALDDETAFATLAEVLG